GFRCEQYLQNICGGIAYSGAIGLLRHDEDPPGQASQCRRLDGVPRCPTSQAELLNAAFFAGCPVADGDDAGRRGSAAIARRLSERMHVEVVNLPDRNKWLQKKS